MVKVKMIEGSTGLPKDESGFYIDGGDQLNGGSEFKDFIKGVYEYYGTEMEKPGLVCASNVVNYGTG
jgi:hypothetical protein